VTQDPPRMISVLRDSHDCVGFLRCARPRGFQAHDAAGQLLGSFQDKRAANRASTTALDAKAPQPIANLRRVNNIEFRASSVQQITLLPLLALNGPAHSGPRPQPIGNSTRDLCRRLDRNREYRTDVYLAEHIAVGSVRRGRPEHEVRVPDHRRSRRGMASKEVSCGVHSSSINRRRRRKRGSALDV